MHSSSVEINNADPQGMEKLCAQIRKTTWWLITVAASLWTSRSSWSAKSLDFIAAADRPQMAACLTFSGETAGEAPIKNCPISLILVVNKLEECC